MANDPTITVTGRRLQIGAAIRRLNPQLFGPVGAMEKPLAQLPERRPRKDPELVKGQQGLAIRVALTSVRRRLLDRDNLIGGLKPLRDAIAAELGLDDNERNIEWEYAQTETRGTEGTLVRIEVEPNHQCPQSTRRETT